jgi:geranylgeranyl pyrophosphate synthase
MTLALEAHVESNPLLELLDEQLTRVVAETAVPEALLGRALYDPLREFLARPKKGLRAALVEAGYSLGGGRGPVPDALPLVVEALHSGSLIIDDIEDASLVRRSRPALHQLFGMPVALNAGNWLYFWALALLERIPGGRDLHAELYKLSTDTFLACHHGQAMDLALEVVTLERKEVPNVVHAISLLKTAALVQYGLLLGGKAAGANRLRLSSLTRLGGALGTAIQMLDDLGGITREDRCLKGHEDLLNARATWPWAWLAPDARDWDELIALAREVRARDTHPELLAERLRASLGDRGHRAVRAQIATALSILENAFERSPASQSLAESIRALEAAYV